MDKETKHRDIDVLIIDDEPAVRTALSRLLRLEGYRVETAESGIKGLQLLRDKDYSVLICDYDMPEMNGGEVFAEAEKMGFHGQQLLLTASEEFETAGTGDVTVVHKPWEQEELVRLMKGRSERN